MGLLQDWKIFICAGKTLLNEGGDLEDENLMMVLRQYLIRHSSWGSIKNKVKLEAPVVPLFHGIRNVASGAVRGEAEVKPNPDKQTKQRQKEVRAKDPERNWL